jgi:hypothetical protein
METAAFPLHPKTLLKSKEEVTDVELERQEEFVTTEKKN